MEKEKKLKIGIIGLGPVGLTLAVHFKQAGCEVAICDSHKDKMNLIRNEGIELIGLIKKSSFFNYNYSSVSELLTHDIDVLITSVKSYQIDTILDQVEKYKHSNLFLLCAQNGIDIGLKYTSHFDESQILRMVINFSGVLNSPNAVNVTTYGSPPNWVASINDTHPEIADMIADTLTDIGMLTKSTDSFTVAEESWKKTILIAAISPLCGISELTMSEAMAKTDTAEIIEQTIMEAMEVAKAEGIKFEPNFVKLSLRMLKNFGEHVPSLAVDIAYHRRTEIDYFNGKIVEYGRKHYLQTPLNLTFTNLVKAITKKEKFE